MSQENVEIVRRGWEAWVRGDLDALLELCDPAVEWDTIHMEGWPEDAVYFGRDGVRRFLEEWLASWERFESGAEKILEAGGDRVVVICWQQGFGPGSEVPVHMNWAQICTLQRGLVCRVEAYSDRAQALEAAGLREEAMSQENVEIVRRSLDAWNRRDIAGALALADPEAEYVNPASAVEPGTRRGTTELSAVLRAQWETLTDGRWEIDRIYDRGEEVIALGRVSRRMPGSDARIEDQVLTSLEDQQRKSRARRNARLRQGRGPIGPRSREAAGVGDVAWERDSLSDGVGSRPQRHDGVGTIASRSGSCRRRGGRVQTNCRRYAGRAGSAPPPGSPPATSQADPQSCRPRAPPRGTLDAEDRPAPTAAGSRRLLDAAA